MGQPWWGAKKQRLVTAEGAFSRAGSGTACTPAQAHPPADDIQQAGHVSRAAESAIQSFWERIRRLTETCACAAPHAKVHALTRATVEMYVCQRGN